MNTQTRLTETELQMVSFLFAELGGTQRPTAEYDAEIGQWAVWCDDDIIGSGATRSAALYEAVNTVRGWEK